MGDFSYRFMSWPQIQIDLNITADSLEFVNCLEDNFFAQHVDFGTRNDAILDLVISDGELPGELSTIRYIDPSLLAALLQVRQVWSLIGVLLLLLMIILVEYRRLLLFADSY